MSEAVVTEAERYQVTAAGFLFCRDCGCLIMEGYRDVHDRLHESRHCEGCGNDDGPSWCEGIQ